MLRKLWSYLFIALCLLSEPFCMAQGYSLGVNNSPTSLGLSFTFDYEDRGEMDVFSINANTYGIQSYRTNDVGITAGWTHNYIYALLEGEDFIARFYAGLGLSAGYVHDFENGIFTFDDVPLSKNMGIYASLLGTAGFRVDFFRPLAIDFSFSLYPGLHIRTEERTGNLNLSFYKNGIYLSFLPTISLIYRL